MIVRFPLELRTKRKSVSLIWRGWKAPSSDDESAWSGARYWGEFMIRDSIKDVVSQVEYNKSWVYICVAYNARAVASQRLRLYSTKKSAAGAAAQRLNLPGITIETRPVSKEQRSWLERNPRLEPWLKRVSEVEEVTEHPFLEMMRTVNSITNQSDLWMLTETFMGLTGNCLWWKRANRLAYPFQLWVLETQCVRPKYGKTIDDYIEHYIYQRQITPVYFEPQEVVHHKYPNPFDPAWGLSPIECLSDPIVINESIYKYERGTFKNMARPDGIVSLPETAELSDKEFKRLKREWKSVYGGPGKAGQVAFLEGGAKYQQISMSPRELSHLEGRRMTREEISDGYGVPMPLLSPEKSNLANSKIAYRQYMRDTIDPKLKLYEQKMNEQLMKDYPEGESLFVAFDNCVPEDTEVMLLERKTNLETAYSSVNIERKKHGEEEVPWGDLPLLSMDIIPFGEEPPAKQEQKIHMFADMVAAELMRRLFE